MLFLIPIEKDLLIKLAVHLNKYKNNKSSDDCNEFKFKNKTVSLNNEQQKIVFDKS
jgi:hypothetical protein